MSYWDLGPPRQPPALSRDEAIEIAMCDPTTPPVLRGLPLGGGPHLLPDHDID